MTSMLLFLTWGNERNRRVFEIEEDGDYCTCGRCMKKSLPVVMGKAEVRSSIPDIRYA
jgi:hypothetical protein